MVRLLRKRLAGKKLEAPPSPYGEMDPAAPGSVWCDFGKGWEEDWEVLVDCYGVAGENGGMRWVEDEDLEGSAMELVGERRRKTIVLGLLRDTTGWWDGGIEARIKVLPSPVVVSAYLVAGVRRLGEFVELRLSPVAQRVALGYHSLWKSSPSVERPHPVEWDRAYSMKMEMDGPRVRGYVDGEQLLEIELEDPLPGCMGVGLGRNETHPEDARVRVGAVHAWRGAGAEREEERGVG